MKHASEEAEHAHADWSPGLRTGYAYAGGFESARALHDDLQEALPHAVRGRKARGDAWSRPEGAYMCTKCGGTRLWGHHKPSTALDPKDRSMPNMYQCSCCREWLDPDELTPGGLTAREHKEMDDKKID